MSIARVDRTLIGFALLGMAAGSQLANASGFSVIGSQPGSGSQPGPWPQILASIGHWPSPAVEAKIFVGPPGSPASANWIPKLSQGCMLVLEGESTLAASFGFRPTQEKVRLASVQDVHRPALPIVFEHPVEIRRYSVPAEATVFAKERWSGAPLVAGMRRGAGAVLWVATSPGKTGYERFPYILQAMSDLGMEAPFQSGRLWAFFDSSYRTRVDLNYFADRWRKAGVGSLHVAAWHFYEPNAERDAYLNSLIDVCHRHAITVYAWVELPHVSEQFWNDHPEWREKTAIGQDAQLDWRKLMNLTNRDCFREVRSGLEAMMRRFDWDGLNMAELYFESLEGAANPARFTPFNAEVRTVFKGEQGWDPLQIYSDRKDAASLRTFLDFRANLAKGMQEEWLAEAERFRSFRPNLDVVLTHVDDRFDAGMKDAIGADAARTLPMLTSRDFTFLVEDPATVWDMGPQRYPEIAKRYQPITPKPERLAIDINVVDRYQDVYPTKQQTGTELFELVHLAASAFPRVALYFENSLLQPDLGLLPSAATVVKRVHQVGKSTVVDAPYGAGIPWRGPALVDGRAWPAQSSTVLWLPAGTHSFEPAVKPVPVHLLDFNGMLEDAEIAESQRISLTYKSPTAALALIDHVPGRLQIDGAETKPSMLEAPGGFVLALPRGEHVATIWFDSKIRPGSS